MRSDTEDLVGSGDNPRRTMPRTTWRTSASGCSSVGFPEAFDFRRAQLVLDALEVDLRFALCGFSERDDVDFMVSLGMND